jgi:hypothetical protein
MKKPAWLFVLCCMLGTALVGAPPKLTLLSPQDGENWRIGSRQTISWSVVPNIETKIFITLWGYNDANQYIPYGVIGEQSYKAGNFHWQVGDCPSRKVTPGNYFIRIWIWVSSVKVIAGNTNPIQITSNWIKPIQTK